MRLTTFTQTRRNEKLFVGKPYAYINNVKNNELRKHGAFVFEVDPSDRALNRTIVIWYGWSAFGERNWLK